MVKCHGCNKQLMGLPLSTYHINLGFKKTGISWCLICFWTHPEGVHYGQPYKSIRELAKLQTGA